MWMYKDGITRFVPEKKIAEYKNMGYKAVEVKEPKLAEDKKPEKKAEKESGAKAQDNADKL